MILLRDCGQSGEVALCSGAPSASRDPRLGPCLPWSVTILRKCVVFGGNSSSPSRQLGRAGQTWQESQPRRSLKRDDDPSVEGFSPHLDPHRDERVPLLELLRQHFITPVWWVSLAVVARSSEFSLSAIKMELSVSCSIVNLTWPLLVRCVESAGLQLLWEKHHRFPPTRMERPFVLVLILRASRRFCCERSGRSCRAP